MTPTIWLATNQVKVRNSKYMVTRKNKNLQTKALLSAMMLNKMSQMITVTNISISF